MQEHEIWIEAARDSLTAVGEAAPDNETLELVAGVIEQLAGTAPQSRDEIVHEYTGTVRRALIDWVEDSYDEGDIEEHERLLAELDEEE